MMTTTSILISWPGNSWNIALVTKISQNFKGSPWKIIGFEKNQHIICICGTFYNFLLLKKCKSQKMLVGSHRIISAQKNITNDTYIIHHGIEWKDNNPV